MQQRQEGDWKKNFNIVFLFCLAHQRCLVVPLRKGFGKDALGLPCFLGLLLMLLWGMFAQDMLLWAWAGLWLVCQLQRRFESWRLRRKGVFIHTQYDGYPVLARCCSERFAKLIVEPLVIGGLGWAAWRMYEENGLPTNGLPYFVLVGLFTLPFVELVKWQVWQRRIDTMADARVEQQQLLGDFNERYGR